jgi:hypothetical protein
MQGRFEVIQFGNKNRVSYHVLSGWDFWTCDKTAAAHAAREVFKKVVLRILYALNLNKLRDVPHRYRFCLRATIHAGFF